MGALGAVGIAVAMAAVIAAIWYVASRLFGRRTTARVHELGALEPPPIDASIDVRRLPLAYFQRWASYGDRAEHRLANVEATEVRRRRLVTFAYTVGPTRGGGLGKGADPTTYVAVTEVPRDWGHLLVAPGRIAPQWRAYLGKPLDLDLDPFEKHNTVFGDEVFARSVLTPSFIDWWTTMSLDQTLEINRGVAFARVNLPIAAAERPAYAGRFLVQAVERIEAERSTEMGGAAPSA